MAASIEPIIMVGDIDQDVPAPADATTPAGLGSGQTGLLAQPAPHLASAPMVAGQRAEWPDPIIRPRDSNLSTRFIFVVAFVACLGLLISNVFWRKQFLGDEGFYGVTAVNMLRSPAYWLRPSFRPDGNFLADKDGFAHPPFNSYLYALSLWPSNARLSTDAAPPPAISLAGPEVIHAVAFALLLYFIFRLIEPFDRKAAMFTVLLLIASPAIRNYYSQLEAEPLMTTSGIAGLSYMLRSGPVAMQLRFVFISGLCLGLAFALKLWLCGPLALAVAAALVLQLRRSPDFIRNILVALAVFAVGFVLPAGLHLAAIALFYPGDLTFWLKNIYFGVFTHAGISGAKMAGAGVSSDWIHPVWYYVPALYRDHFFLVPIILLGAAALFRAALAPRPTRVSTEADPARPHNTRQLLLILAAGLAGVFPLSLIKVKEPLYVLSCSIFLYCLAGLCLAALVRRFTAEPTTPSGWIEKLGLIGTFGVLAGLPVLYALHVQQGKITGWFVVGHSLVIALLLFLVWMSRGRAGAPFERGIQLACVVAIAGSLGLNLLTARPQDKAISRLIAPQLAANAPRELSFIASNYKSYQYSTFRSGCYWHELDFQQTPETVLSVPGFNRVWAFILDKDDLQKPEIVPWLAWLQSHATEKTGELNAQLGTISGLRVFVR